MSSQSSAAVNVIPGGPRPVQSHTHPLPAEPGPATDAAFQSLLSGIADAAQLALAGEASMSPERKARIVANLRGVSRESWAFAVARETERASVRIERAESRVSERAARAFVAVETTAEIRRIDAIARKAGREAAKRERDSLRLIKR